MVKNRNVFLCDLNIIQRCPLSKYTSNSFGSPRQRNLTSKQYIKGIQIREIKLSLFADVNICSHVNIHIEI